MRLITTVFHEPFMMLKQSFNSTQSEETIARGTVLDPSMVEGYCADLAYAIFHEKLKIPYKFVIETKYGMKISEGVWDGIIGELMTRRADLAITTLTINAARAKVVDFSSAFMNFGISIMMKKPKQFEPVMLPIVSFLTRKSESSVLFVKNRECSLSWLRCL